MKKTYVGLIAVMFTIAAIGAFYIKQGREYGLKKRVAEAQATIKPAKLPNSGQIYNNDRIGARLTLPNDFTARNYSPVSVFVEPETQAVTGKETRFVYVTVMRVNKEEELRDGYNYSPDTYEKLQKMNVGDVTAINDAEGQEEWYTYQRLKDRRLADMTAKVFVNEKPWEFPSGTTEYRFLMQSSNRIIIVGGYVGDLGDPDLDYKKFDSILATLVLSFTETNF